MRSCPTWVMALRDVSAPTMGEYLRGDTRVVDASHVQLRPDLAQLHLHHAVDDLLVRHPFRTLFALRLVFLVVIFHAAPRHAPDVHNQRPTAPARQGARLLCAAPTRRRVPAGKRCLAAAARGATSDEVLGGSERKPSKTRESRTLQAMRNGYLWTKVLGTIKKVNFRVNSTGI